jgi:DNA-binding CsgD family transcriptional regulator
LLGRQGRRAECRSAGDEAMRLCREHDIHLGRCWLLSGLGDLELALGDPVAAAARYGELEKSLVALEIRDPDLSAGPDLVEALLATGRDSEAAGVAAGFEARAEAKGRPWARARACRAAGLLADDHGIDAPFRASLALHADTLDGYERARTQLAYGERLRRARRRIDARPLLRSALATFEQLRATPWANRAARELEATGEAVRRHGQPTTAVLTPQELQISLLLAEGRTTRAVAAALFLSPKTVEYHLRKVYTKLGVRSRAELADSLHTADI